MSVLKNICLMVLSSVLVPGQAHKLQPAKLPDFASVSVACASTDFFNPLITISGDGSYDYQLRRMGRKGEDYAASYRLKPEHLRQLEALLRATDWLTKPGAVDNPYLKDAMKYTITIVRNGREATAVCYGDQPSEYAALIQLFERINRQERLLYNVTIVPNGMRTVVHELESELQDLQSEPYFIYAPVLDYQRLVHIFGKTLAEPAGRPADQVVVAIRLFAFLRNETQRGRIVALAQHHDSDVRRAVVEALCQLGGSESIAVIREMLRTTGDEAAWGLIRLGEAAIPTIVDALEQPPNENDSSPVDIVRAYIDNWESVPKPLDKRIIKAVWEDMDYRREHRSGWTSYHKQLLGLANVTDADCRQLAEVGQGTLKGGVFGPDGELAKGYEVEVIRAKDRKSTCLSNKQGRYELSNLPAGFYKVNCRPRSGRLWRLTVSKVRIRPNESTALDLSFERRYTFSGKVSYEDGRAPAGVGVQALWRSVGARGEIELAIFEQADPNGHYTIGVPFKNAASSVNVGDFDTDYVGRRKPYRNVAPGRTDIDFVLRKRKGHEGGSTNHHPASAVRDT